MAALPGTFLWRRWLFRAYAAMATFFFGWSWTYGLLTEPADVGTIVMLGLALLLMILQLMLIKWAALVMSAVFALCFLIIEALPQWDAPPQMSLWFIRLIGFLFLIPLLLTVLCWKGLGWRVPHAAPPLPEELGQEDSTQ